MGYFIQRGLFGGISIDVSNLNKPYSGGGWYDEAGSFKSGRWIELSDGFKIWS